MKGGWDCRQDREVCGGMERNARARDCRNEAIVEG